MGCSTSSQTAAVDTTRPSAKPEESNGASTTGAANENGKGAEDSETIPDQTPAEGADNAAPPAGEEAQPAAANKPAEAAAPKGAQAAADSTTEKAASSPEPAAAAPDQGSAEATATQSEPKTEETPAPSQ